MFQWLAGLLAGPAARAAMEAFRAAQRRGMSEAAARAEVEKAVAAAIEKVAAAELSARRDVLIAELSGESRLQRAWRPVVALTAFFSYWYVVVLLPHLVSWGWMKSPGFGERGLENLFWLTVLCVGGYIGGRTAEKIAGLFRFR